MSLCGATLEEIRVRGDWTSNAVFLYLQTPLSVRILNDMRVATILAGNVWGTGKRSLAYYIYSLARGLE